MKKLKYLLASGLLIITSLTVAGCNDSKKDDSKNTTQTEEKKDDVKKNEEKELTYYTFDINSEKVTENRMKVKKVDANELISVLKDKKVVPADTTVKSSEITDIDGVKTMKIDLNEKFVDTGTGSTQELLMLQCLTNSIVKTFDVEQVKLTVEGNNYEGGHVVLKDDQYLKFK